MSDWQKIGLAISILWLIGLSIFLVVYFQRFLLCEVLRNHPVSTAG
jgi:hypothetical protein